MTIDMHCHFLPEALAEALRRRDTAPAIETLPDGSERRLMPAGNALPYSDEYSDVAGRIAFMDRLGIERQVLSMGLLFGIHALAAEESVPLCRSFNDGLADMVRRQPERFSAIAMLPLADMDAAIAEYRRARTDLGLIGAILPANSFLDLATAQPMRPLFAAAAELGGHMLIHPGRRANEPMPPGGPRPVDNATYRRSTLTVQANLSQAVLTFTLTDFLAPYGEVTVHVANLGGTLPFVLERMDHTAALRMPDAPPPSAGVGRMFVDCASLGPRAITLARAVFGAGNIFFGSDCPIFSTERTLAAVAAADISDADRRLILHDNAAHLLAPHLGA